MVRRRSSHASSASQSISAGRGKIVVVVSGKGGVGKTVLALNLGVQLAQHGVETTLLDADFGLTNASILLNVERTADLRGLIESTADVRDRLAVGPHGLRVLCGAPRPEHDDADDFDPAACVRLVERLGTACEVLLIDCDSGLSRTTETFALVADELLIVATPEPTSLANAYTVLKRLHSCGLSAKASVVVNMATNGEARRAFARLSAVARQFLGLKLSNLGGVPYDRHVQRAVRARSPVAISYPGCAANLSMASVVDRLMSGKIRKAIAGGFWSSVAGLFF